MFSATQDFYPSILDLLTTDRKHQISIFNVALETTGKKFSKCKKNMQKDEDVKQALNYNQPVADKCDWALLAHMAAAKTGWSHPHWGSWQNTGQERSRGFEGGYQSGKVSQLPQGTAGRQSPLMPCTGRLVKNLPQCQKAPIQAPSWGERSIDFTAIGHTKCYIWLSF